MLACLFLGAACAPPSRGGGEGGSGGNADAGQGGDRAGGEGGTGGVGGAGGGSDRPPGSGEQCKRIDVVFAIDGSPSMLEEQKSMTEIIGGFAAELIKVGPQVKDFRIAVTDACPYPAVFHDFGRRSDGTIGDCMFEGGHRWMESTSKKLVGEFECAGQLPTVVDPKYGCMIFPRGPHDEQPTSTAAECLEPPASAPGGPNEGFLRDDAVLVVVALTDEDEQPNPDRSAKAIFDRLVKIKGDAKKIVFLGIGGTKACCALDEPPHPPDGVYGCATKASKLAEIASLFAAEGRGLFWDICGGGFDKALAEALKLIGTACREWCGTAKCS